MITPYWDKSHSLMSYKVAYQITELALHKKLQNNYCI